MRLLRYASPHRRRIVTASVYSVLNKITLVKLLLRFADVDSGRITVDGHDVRDATLASLRGSIGLVSQDVFLFHGTVADNIAYIKETENA